jgi:hypothetical protein
MRKYPRLHRRDAAHRPLVVCRLFVHALALGG